MEGEKSFLIPGREGRRWTDVELAAEIERLQSALQAWLEKRGLWFDCGFQSYLERVNGEPGTSPIVTMLHYEGLLYEVLNGHHSDDIEEEFRQYLATLGYFRESVDNVTSAIYAEDESLAEAFASYFHWQWVCGLIKDDTGDVYQELYEQFAKRPEDLQRLGWRDFEILLFRIFQNQGFKAMLGPGRADEGVDIRLALESPLGDTLTVVQVKHRATGRAVNLTDVAALYGVGHVEKADKTLFVTSSTYAPVAKRYAARTNGYVDLAEASDVIRWCERASAGIIQDKSSLVSRTHVERLVADVALKNDARIVRASGGYNMTDNWFALILKETKYAALLMSIPNIVLTHDGYGQRGTHVPRLDAEAILSFGPESVWRVIRSQDDNRVMYWDGERLYTPWNGQPCHFDYCD